jgi:hypothetical protein
MTLIYIYSVLSQLLAATEQNNFVGLYIYGLLTNLTQFKFYLYNSSTKQFCFDKTILINNRKTEAFSDMIDGLGISSQRLPRADWFSSVSNKIFRAIISQSKDRTKENDVSSTLY